MAKIYRLIFNPIDEEEADRQTMGLASIAIALLLIIASLIVIKQLRHATHIEDCLMQGRTNCDVQLPHVR